MIAATMATTTTTQADMSAGIARGAGVVVWWRDGVRRRVAGLDMGTLLVPVGAQTACRSGRACCSASSTSSWTRSALMAIAAAEPAPAEVMTWARGSTTLPAAQTPGLLVRPVASTVTKPASFVSQPRAASEAVVVGDVARPDEHRRALDDAAVGQVDAAELVVLDDQPCHRRRPRCGCRERRAGGARRR